MTTANKIFISALLLLCASFVYALTVTDVTTTGRSLDGNIVSDADTDPEVPIFGNVQNSGSGNVTITWSPVETDTLGNPVTIHNYELRYKLNSDTVYTLITVPPPFTGHSLTLSTGSYSGYIEAVSDGGYLSTVQNFTIEVP